MKFSLGIDHKCGIKVLKVAITEIIFSGDGSNRVHFTLQTFLLDDLQGLRIFKILREFYHKFFSVG
jgi:hypothetical protein